MAISLHANVSFFDPCQNENVNAYATTKQLEKNAFKGNNEKMNQKICIQVRLHLGN